jgi:hypothetical protein
MPYTFVRSMKLVISADAVRAATIEDCHAILEAAL